MYLHVPQAEATWWDVAHPTASYYVDEDPIAVEQSRMVPVIHNLSRLRRHNQRR
jgi:hypothetical protein